MNSIQDYINLSPAATSVKKTYTTANEFSKNYNEIYENEKKSFLRHYLTNNTPYVFRQRPILFEQITQYLADRLKIPLHSIKLIGSAKTGFSISPDNFGKQFSENSDLDFSIVCNDIFESLSNEFDDWSTSYKNKLITPKNEKEKFFWDTNAYEVPQNQIKKGFIDTNKIPNYTDFPIASKINQSLYLIVSNLKNKHSIGVSKASVRVYCSWETFFKRMRLNTETALSHK